MKKKTYYNQIVKKAMALDSQFNALKQKMEALQNEIADYSENYDYDDYIYNLKDLEITLDELINFDLIDHIPDTHKY